MATFVHTSMATFVHLLEIARLKECLLAAQEVAKAKSNPPQQSYASVKNEGKLATMGIAMANITQVPNVNVVVLMKVEKPKCPLKSLLSLLVQ